GSDKDGSDEMTEATDVRQIPKACVDLVNKFEGFSAKPYFCPAGKKTIGYGHVLLPSESLLGGKKPITTGFAEELFEWDLRQRARQMLPLVKVPLKDNQFSALLSFVYNIGIGQFKESTLLKKLNDGKYEEAAKQFDRWIYAKGKTLS